MRWAQPPSVASAACIAGGSLDGAANIIAFNGKTFQEGGVNIFSGRRIPILNNSNHDNSGLGIVLFNTVGQPLPNDSGDGDSGPNDLQNYPTLTQAATAAGRTLVADAGRCRPDREHDFLDGHPGHDAVRPDRVGAARPRQAGRWQTTQSLCPSRSRA